MQRGNISIMNTALDLNNYVGRYIWYADTDPDNEDYYYYNCIISLYNISDFYTILNSETLMALRLIHVFFIIKNRKGNSIVSSKGRNHQLI